MIIKFNNFKILIIASSLVTLGITIIVYKRKQSRKHPSKKNLTIIHYKDSFSKCPSRSVELIQLETWLRISNIRYDLKLINSSFFIYQNRPKISLNGTVFSDINEAFDYLEKINGQDLSDGLNKIEKCLERSFTVFFTHSLKQSILVFIYFYGNRNDIEISWFELLFNKFFFKRELILNNYSRSSKKKGNKFFNFLRLSDPFFKVFEEIEHDLMTIQDFLKQRKFLFGEIPNGSDAALFASLSQLICLNNPEFNQQINQKFYYLSNYFETIKKVYWKDWQERSC